MLKVTNPNYCATVVEIKTILPLEWCDNVVGVPVFGYQAIVSKDIQVGQIGIIFPPETVLSDDYCSNNNLYRHTNLNKDVNAQGYMEDSRRVKAMKFRGHKSSALFMPLESLSYLGIDPSKLQINDDFNEVNGQEICTKYLSKNTLAQNKIKGTTKRFDRIDNKTFPEHFSTDNYWKNKNFFDWHDVVVTQKLHWCSMRLGNCLVRRPLTIREKILSFFWAKINTTEYDGVRGSRKVIKNGSLDQSKTSQHYYSEDIWKKVSDKYAGAIPKDYILYGEIIGWVGNSPIQNAYTYNLAPGDAELYIYRVTIVNQDGLQTDLSWNQVKEFCDNNWFKYVPELYVGSYENFTNGDPDAMESWMNRDYSKDFINAIALSKDSPCDEGVCIRREGLQPYIAKAKASSFLEAESKWLDKEVVDLESNESV